MTMSGGERSGPRGLGGWLILPMIGLAVAPMRLLAVLVTDYAPIFQDGVWENLTTPGSGAYHILWGPLIIFEIVGNLFFVVGAGILLVLLLKKSYRFPALMIGFLLLNPAFVVLDHILGNLIPFIAELDDTESYTEIVRAAVAAMIWIPYFLVSKRVKNTFVKPGVDESVVQTFD